MDPYANAVNNATASKAQKGESKTTASTSTRAEPPKPSTGRAFSPNEKKSRSWGEWARGAPKPDSKLATRPHKTMSSREGMQQTSEAHHQQGDHLREDGVSIAQQLRQEQEKLKPDQKKNKFIAR